MFLHVVSAKHICGYKVQVSFNDGTHGDVDLSSELEGPVFEPLKDVKYFKNFQLIGNTLAWDNGADFAPEFLKESLTKKFRFFCVFYFILYYHDYVFKMTLRY